METSKIRQMKGVLLQCAKENRHTLVDIKVEE